MYFFLATCFMEKSRNRDAHFHLIPYNMEGPRYTEPVLLFVFNNIFLLLKSGVPIYRQMTKYETMILARLVGKG